MRPDCEFLSCVCSGNSPNRAGKVTVHLLAEYSTKAQVFMIQTTCFTVQVLSGCKIYKRFSRNIQLVPYIGTPPQVAWETGSTLDFTL